MGLPEVNAANCKMIEQPITTICLSSDCRSSAEDQFDGKVTGILPLSQLILNGNRRHIPEA